MGVARGGVGGVGWRASPPPSCGPLTRCFSAVAELLVLQRLCRPWYVHAATYPKDMVIMIDKSMSMNDAFGTESRLFYAIKAVQSVIDTLNPYDHVSIRNTRFA